VRKWVRRVEIDEGQRPGLTTDERERLNALERENRELRRAPASIRAFVARRRLEDRDRARSPGLVEVTEELIESAAQLAETEWLRGYDAVHLAAALFVGAAAITSADRELCEAAERQGLHIADPLTA
jgi:predicted nucleic acid-binding protein